MKGPIWKGVYEGFSEVPQKGPSFRSRRYIKNALARVLEVHLAAKDSRG